jgi:hypothetical protein
VSVDIDILSPIDPSDFVDVEDEGKAGDVMVGPSGALEEPAKSAEDSLSVPVHCDLENVDDDVVMGKDLDPSDNGKM